MINSNKERNIGGSKSVAQHVGDKSQLSSLNETSYELSISTDDDNDNEQDV